MMAVRDNRRNMDPNAGVVDNTVLRGNITSVHEGKYIDTGYAVSLISFIERLNMAGI